MSSRVAASRSRISTNPKAGPTSCPAGLVEQATWESEQYSIPVGVHRGNGFWYNKRVMDDNGIEVGDTMSVDEFFAAADTLKAAGIPALALGNSEGHFPGAQTFENTLLGVVGPETYNALFRGETALGRPGRAREAAETYAKMLDYVNEDFSALAWSDAIALVIEGKAGFNSMGDWAYGEVARQRCPGQHRLGKPSWNRRLLRARRRQLHAAGWARRIAENARNWLIDPRLEGSARGIQSAEGLDPGANRCQPRPLLAISSVVDGQLRQRRAGAVVRPRPGIVASVPAGVLRCFDGVRDRQGCRHLLWRCSPMRRRWMRRRPRKFLTACELRVSSSSSRCCTGPSPLPPLPARAGRGGTAAHMRFVVRLEVH